MIRSEAPAVRPLDLKRRLLWRVTLFALALLLTASAWTLQQAVERIRTDIARTGETIRQLIGDEVSFRTSAFDRQLGGLSLDGLTGIGELVHFCAAIEDIYRTPLTWRCFGEAQADAQARAPAPLVRLLRELVGPDVVYRGSIGAYPGVKLGELGVTPNFDSEALQVWRQLRTILAITGGVLLINLLVYRPVRRALAPTEEILQVLARMQAGDLSARMPAFELVELASIARVFNHLAERLQQTLHEQRLLAQRLLQVREDERRHLARELHDELGQYLVSVGAEAAYAGDVAREQLPALLPCTEAIGRTTARMVEVLQQILHRLRPVGLEEFGLVASLEQMVEDWQRRSRGQCRYALELRGAVGDLPDELNVNLYRLVQESLTNAAKHGRATTVAVRLAREPGGAVTLSIEDDGVALDAATSPRPGGGHGLLGMHERVQALGGRLAVERREPHGVRVAVWLPAPDLSALVPQGAAALASGAAA